MKYVLQWNFSITDNLGTEKHTEVSTIQRLFYTHNNLLGLTKQSVIERFPLLGEFVIRGSV